MFRSWMLCILGAVILMAPQASYSSPVGEVEPNETVFTAVPLLPGQFGQGAITSGPEFDGWMIPNVQTDQFFCMLLNVIESTLPSGDPVLSLYYDKVFDDTINADHYNDDGGPPSVVFSDSMFCGEKVKKAGAIFARVDGFGSSTFAQYNLYQTVISPNEVLPEAEPNDTASTAMPIQSPAILANGGSDFDFYSFNAHAGEKIVVLLDQDPGRPDPGTPFVASIAIFDTDGVTDITNSVPGEHLSDPTPPSQFQGYGALPAPHTGTFYVRITKASGDDGDYRLVVLVDGAAPVLGACCVLGQCSLRSAVNCRGKFGGIGTVCGGDPDADGYFDGCDNCSSAANPEQEDADADDVGDICDTCATDGLKVIPGACGCGTKDTDTDGDGVADCNDQCPINSNESIPGACGCGVVESDGNGNGVFDCQVGEDGKATLRSRLQDLSAKLTSLKTKKKPSKKVATPIKDLLSQIQAVVQAAGSQIGLSQGGFDLNAETAKLSKVIGSALKSKGKKLKKNRSNSLKQVQAILNAL